MEYGNDPRGYEMRILPNRDAAIYPIELCNKVTKMVDGKQVITYEPINPEHKRQWLEDRKQAKKK